MHRPLRPASAEPATLTVAAAYEGAVLTTTCTLNRALTCSDGPVRFGEYNGLMTTTPVLPNTFTSSSTAAPAVAR